MTYDFYVRNKDDLPIFQILFRAFPLKNVAIPRRSGRKREMTVGRGKGRSYKPPTALTESFSRRKPPTSVTMFSLTWQTTDGTATILTHVGMTGW